MCKLQAFCSLLGGCQYKSEEAKAECLFALAILHRDSFIMFKAYGKRGDILLQPSSYDNLHYGDKSRSQMVKHFKTKLLMRLPHSEYEARQRTERYKL